MPPTHHISQGLSTHLELSSQREQRHRHVMEEGMRKRIISIDQRTGNSHFAEHMCEKQVCSKKSDRLHCSDTVHDEN